MRVYALDVLPCKKCGGRLRIIAFLSDVRVVRRILARLRIPPVVAPRPRAPPEADLPSTAEVQFAPGVAPPGRDTVRHGPRGT